MKMRGTRSASGQKIVDAFARAKQSDPTMTQARFYQRARVEAGLDPISDPGAEYRRIARGERSGNITYKRALGIGKDQKAPKSRGLFQMAFMDTNGRDVIASENLSVFGGPESTFDIPAIEAEIKAKHRAHLEEKAQQFGRRYAISGIDPANVRVRLVNQQHARAFHLSFPKR